MEVSTARAASEALPFWKGTKTEAPQKRLSPAKVELLAGPDLTHGLATFKLQDFTMPVDFIPTNSKSDPFVKKEQEGYRIVPDGIKKGSNPFSDRDYKITLLPERLGNLTLLQTKMGHKGIVDARFGILLSVSRPVYLFLAIDERVLSTFEGFGTPIWMQEFAPTGEKIVTDDPVMKETSSGYLVFVKQCPSGRIVLGPCCANPFNNAMYFAFFAQLDQKDQ